MLSFIDTDLKRVILWQYENAEKLKALITDQDEWHRENNRLFFQKLHDDFFNIDTANEWGIRLWARILKVPLAKYYEPQSSKIAFGFGSKRRNFKSNFGSRDGGKVNLTLDQLRMMIKMRYFRLTNQATVYNVNKFLSENITDGNMYVIDGMDMTFAYYVLDFSPDSSFKLLLEDMDFLPRPCGVGTKYNIVGSKKFGFSKNRKNFYQSNFGRLGAKNGRKVF